MFPFLGLNQRGNPATHPSREPANLSCGTAFWRGAERLPVFQVWVIIAQWQGSVGEGQGSVGEGQGMLAGAGWALSLSGSEGEGSDIRNCVLGTRLDSL